MQNHFKTKKKHKEAKDKTSTRQNVGKAGRIANEEDKEGGERGRSGRSRSERTWGKQAEYFSAPPKERQTKEERKAQNANREWGRTRGIF